MKVDILPSSSAYTDDDQNNLKSLLEALGSAVSLEDIASAYCETGRNLDLTAERLCYFQGNSSGTSSSKSQEDVDSKTKASSGSSSDSSAENTNMVKLKEKKCSASMGTVSNVIGKDYIRPRPQMNGINDNEKPMKLNSDDFPVSVSIYLK